MFFLTKNEVCIMFDQFHSNEVVIESYLSYFAALIPKIFSPMSLKDFWPISLLGSLDKISSTQSGRNLVTVWWC